MDNNKLQPAITGGVVLGLLSSIPFINLPNACCCSWAILGGALASYLYIKKSPAPVQMGEGAILGAMAGGIGAVINLVIGLPLGLMTGAAFTGMMTSLMAHANPEQAEQLRQQIELQQSMGIGAQLVAALPFTFVSLLLLVVFATLGGLIAIPIFEKRKGGPGAGSPPPPPQGFGGGQPGSGYSAGPYGSSLGAAPGSSFGSGIQ